MDKKYEDLSEITVESIRKSTLDPGMKTMLVELVENARRGTNGCTKDEKIQIISETQFSLAVLMTQFCLANLETSSSETPSWRSVIVKCRKDISFVIVSALIALLIRPQLAQVFTLFTGS